MFRLAKRVLVCGTVIVGSGSIAVYRHNDKKAIIIDNDALVHQVNTLRYEKRLTHSRQTIDIAFYHEQKITPTPNPLVDHSGATLTRWYIPEHMTEDDFKEQVEFEIKHRLASYYYRQIMAIMLSITNDKKYIMPTYSKMPCQW